MVTRTAPSPLPHRLVGTIALVIVLATPLIWLVGGDAGSFYVLCLASTCALVGMCMAIRQTWRVKLHMHWIAIAMNIVAITMPVATLCLFVIVFIIGQSSNVAQMAGSSGFDYWRLWFDAWLVLFFGNPVCISIALTSMVMPPYRRRYVAAWALPIAVLIAAVAAMHITTVYFPDA